MKKITLLVFILTAYIGYSQATHTIDFEPAGVGSGWSWTATEVAPSFAEITNPVSGGINTSATVVEFIAYTTDMNWALCHTDDNNTFTFDATNSTVKIMVYKPTISNVGMKFEGASPAIELTVPNTVINQWEELTFDFSGQIGNTYNKIVVIPDFVDWVAGAGKDRTTDNTLYFDNIQVPEGALVETCSDGIMNQDETGIDCGGTICAECPPPGETSFTNDFEDGTVGDYGVGVDGGTLTVIDNPDFVTRSSSSVLDNTSAKAAQLAGINITQWTHIEKTSATSFDLSSGDRGFSVQVKGPSAVTVKFKLEGGTAVEVDADYTDVGNWQNLTFDFSSNTSINNNKVVVFFDIGNTTDVPGGTFLFDDIKMAEFATLGTNSFESINFNVYPNPSNNVWNVKTKDQIIKTVQVFDVLGKEVMNMKPNLSDVSIDASTLPKGLYFAKLTTDLGSNSVKLIKN